MNELRTTTNRYVYNRLIKQFIANKEGLCTYCKYHRNENQTSKSYDGHLNDDFTFNKNLKLTIPNWKLVSKNKKQWMGKKIRIKKGRSSWCVSSGYFTFEF
jgi:hypothetical protein